MKYKVGDKVKLRNDLIVGKCYGNIEFLTGMEELLNKELTIQSINYANNVFESEETWYYLSFEMIKDYTWEDFLKAPIGTKVTFESGEILFKADKDEYGEEFTNTSDVFSYEYLENFELKKIKYGKIIKIEEPTYITVYEPQEITMPEIEEMKRLKDELCRTCDEFIKKIKEK